MIRLNELVLLLKVWRLLLKELLQLKELLLSPTRDWDISLFRCCLESCRVDVEDSTDSTSPKDSEGSEDSEDSKDSKDSEDTEDSKVGS